MLTEFTQRAKQCRRRIVLPESVDLRILEAAQTIDRQCIADIVLLGNRATIRQRFKEGGLDLGTISIVDPAESQDTEIYAESFYQVRKNRGLTREQAMILLRKPLYFAAMMVHSGVVDGCVAGAACPTADVVRAALEVIGTHGTHTRLSSFFIMNLAAPHSQPVFFADCAINVSPDARVLADIALQSATNARRLLGLEARVAMLSFSTNLSADQPQSNKVREATEILKRKQPELSVIGDVQFDAAFSAEVLKNKWQESTFEAPANVFIFPTLDAGNIGYKIAERLGGATAVGPIFQGLNKPMNDLSRGCDVESIVDTIAITCLQVC